eukprot:364060-Chlamydomonas_euryale.AAC.9
MHTHTHTHTHTHAHTHRHSLTHLLKSRQHATFHPPALHSAPQDIAVSSGSACTSASLEPSYVLRALGVDEDMAHTSIRYGIGRFTTEAEIDHAIELTVSHVNKLREMSPLWVWGRCMCGGGSAACRGGGWRAASEEGICTCQSACSFACLPAACLLACLSASLYSAACLTSCIQTLLLACSHPLRVCILAGWLAGWLAG